MKNFIRSISTASILAFAAISSVQAAEFILDDAGNGKRAAGSSSVLVGFSGNAEITDAQVDVTYDPAQVSVSVKALGKAGCSNPTPGLIRVVSPDLGGQALGEKVGAYCQVTVTALKGKALVANALTTANAYCSGIGGVQKTCQAEATLSK